MSRKIQDLEDHRKALSGVKGWPEFDRSMTALLETRSDVRLVYMWSDLYAETRQALRGAGFDVARGIRYRGRSIVSVPKC